MANGRVRRQCFENHAQADCDTCGYDKDKTNLGFKIGEEGKASCSSAIRTQWDPGDTIRHLRISLVWPTD